MSEKKNEVPGIFSVGIKMDLARFKDEILKDIRSVQLSLDDKYLKADDFLKQRINQFEIKINSFEKKISELSNLIVTDQSIREKVESLNQFKEEMKDIMFKRRAKFNDFETTINNDISRINSILTASVIYPSLIGKSAKFKTFHEFMDYIVQEIAQLVIFKDKSGLDLTPYKRKIDQTIEAFKLQMSGFSSKEYIDNAAKAIEERIKGMLKVFDDRLQDTRVENSHYSFGIKKKAEEIEKQIETLEKMQKDIMSSFENHKKDESITINNNDINSIKSRLNKINEVIKELLNYHPNTKKNFIHEFEKKSSKVYSGVKQYIKGNLNANELSSMKKFTYEKSKTKILDNSYSPSISSFAYQDLIKNNNEFRKRNSHIVNNEQFLFPNSRNNKEQFDKSKIFLSKKTMNYSNQTTNKLYNYKDDLDRVNNNYIDDNEKEKEKENTTLNRRGFFRKKTYNFTKIKSFENNENNLISDQPNKIINLIKSNFNNEEPSSLGKEEENYKIINDDNQISKDNTIKDKSATNIQFIIKEEDENLLSDNSCKNLEIVKDKIPSKIIRINSKEKEIDKNKINNEDSKKNNNLTNNNEIKIPSINKEPDKVRIKSLKELINSNNTENNNLKIISFNLNSTENKNSSVNLVSSKENKQENQVKFDLGKNNSNNNNNLAKISNDNNNSLTPRLNNMEESKENLRKIFANKNSSYPKIAKNSNNILSKSNLQKPQQYQHSNNLENNKNKNNYPVNYNYKTNFKNPISINKMNKTHTSFPRINQEPESKTLLNNNYFESKDINIFTKTLSAAKMSNKVISKTSQYEKTPKKVLLINPDNIPPNMVIRRKIKNINKNNAIGLQSDKIDKTKKMDNLYYNKNQYFMPNQLNSTDDEIHKSLNSIKINKSP